MIKLIIFDLDGVLVEAKEIHFEALNQARNRGLDLVEIHEKSHPPVCKIMDYRKWKFELKKKEKQNKKIKVKF